MTQYGDELPAGLSDIGLESSAGTLLVYDEVLDSQFGAFIDLFDLRYPVTAGEGLKDLAGFDGHAREVLGLVGPAARDEITIVAAGGGSVGDFSGFLASVLKRGVRLIAVPTTWLSAMDSAHGGKSALNVGGVKNQIGTFHPAAEVWVFKPFLAALGASETRAACGELLKMAMLVGGPLFEGTVAAPAYGTEELWTLLPGAVAAKEAVVATDPTEESGRRQVLNLGHTFGHALEAHYGIAHGVAVGCGLRFAIEWSQHSGRLDAASAAELLGLISRFDEFDKAALESSPALGAERLGSLLDQDKKSLGPGRVNFVFLGAIGEPLLEGVTVADVIAEAERQGWL